MEKIHGVTGTVCCEIGVTCEISHQAMVSGRTEGPIHERTEGPR